MNIYFTSDLHFDHANIIKYCNRPFSDAKSMTEQLILNWNAQVAVNDLVFVLGDFVWGFDEDRLISITNRLNGRKVLVRGNHDNFTNEQYLNAGFDKVSNLVEIKLENIDFVLCHYQMAFWNNSHHGSIHLYGHQHDKRQYTPNHLAHQQLGMSEKKMNICIDSNKYQLYELNEIILKMENRPTNWWVKN